ncbi:glucose-1-phosphate adenylyltransferase [Halorhodospira halochloris]|uniref:Glucose-1-phosphate adenylyltransferase n=1 Tax=Halorhodospira halochloris TaxID=1052 RepID=A0A0X8X8J9_HALHR|nr:glucose-1-phosphate adenylyltransferase [Halorhodospira halochloris]MBK1652902.1 glucose-1-phosphate adenylyltransferase [Halorhodospira halochloris]BAU56987.1 glucose-1-phosphate adenylyltransferase [Halorhodospira halochloris]
MQENASPRYVSRLTRNTLALILAGGRGTRLKHLTQWRAKPAVPFGGKFRIIDFPLSNCVNSGIRRIGVLTQYKAHSLIRHIRQGWSSLRADFSEFVELLPAQQRIETSWYLGTADAVYQSLDIVRMHNPELVLILAGDHVYKMDYGPLLAYHVEKGADVTVGCIEVPLDEASAFGLMNINEDNQVVRFEEKPADPTPMPGSQTHSLASMGIYVFNREFMFKALGVDARTSSEHDFGKDIIPSLIDKAQVYAYPFRDPATGDQSYWRDVGTVDAFWRANLELVEVTPELNLCDREWPIWTFQEQLPPAKFVFDEDQRRGMVVDSMVSGGCIVAGAYLRRSVLFSSVVVDERTKVQDSVILPEARIEPGCRISNAVIDKHCRIEAGTVIGEDPEEDARRFHVTDSGVVLVTPDMLGQEIHVVY